MKASDLTYIADPHVRMVQATKFLRQLETTRNEVIALRDEALRLCVDVHGEKQVRVADALGVNSQRVAQLLRRARETHEATSPPFTE